MLAHACTLSVPIRPYPSLSSLSARPYPLQGGALAVTLTSCTLLRDVAFSANTARQGGALALQPRAAAQGATCFVPDRALLDAEVAENIVPSSALSSYALSILQDAR